MLSRQDGLEQEVVDKTARSLVPVLLGDSEAKRQSVLRALDGLDADLNVVVEALLPLLQETEPTKEARHVIVCYW